MIDYRYELHRHVRDNGRGRLCWIMLNPSTADETNDDATIRRVKAFTGQFGFNDLTVVNLYAARTTDPAKLKRMINPVGINNDRAIKWWVSQSDMVIAAWGAATGVNITARAVTVERMVADMVDQVYCLRTTKHGHPSHPLYLPSTCEPMPFKWPVA